MQASSNSQKVALIATGGTIAGVSMGFGAGQGYRAAQVDVSALRVGDSPVSSDDWVSEQLAQVDSKDMSHVLWQALVRRVDFYMSQPQIRAVVITHGTDTLEETAYFLHAVLRPTKPVILTGAMRPSDAWDADGPTNLADALCWARSDTPSGVWVVFAGHVHAARDVQKLDCQRLDAFSSGDAGPLASLRDGKWVQARPRAQANVAGNRLAIWPAANEWPRVEMVMSHAGQSGAVIRGLLQPDEAGPLRGLVVVGTGAATVHAEFWPALALAQARGVRCVRVSRCPFGEIGNTGESPVTAGVSLPVWRLSAAKARIRLMLEIMGSIGCD